MTKAATRKGVARKKRIRTQPGSVKRDGLADAIIAHLRNGESLLSACRAEKIGYSTFKEWLSADPTLAATYACAREELEEVWHDRIHSVAQAATPDMAQVARLQVDALKWSLARMNPRRYGDRVETVVEGGERPVKTEGTLSVALDFESIRARRGAIGA